MFKKRAKLYIGGEGKNEEVSIPVSELPENFSKYAGEKFIVVTGDGESCKIKGFGDGYITVVVPSLPADLYVQYDYQPTQDFGGALEKVEEAISRRNNNDVVAALDGILEMLPSDFDDTNILSTLGAIKERIKEPKDYEKKIDDIQKSIENLAILVSSIQSPEIPLQDGRILVNVDKVGSFSAPRRTYNATYQAVNPATEEKQTATNTKLDSQIALQTTLNSLIETLQELTQRLAPLAGAMANTAQLRVVATGTVTASGPITSAQSIAEKAVGGIMYAEKMAITNNTAIQSNINNTTA